MKLIVYNDTHIGVNRVAGTTPTTAWNLRQRALVEFGGLMDQARGHSVLLLGDLFDTGSVPMADWIETFQILHKWLRLPGNGCLYMVPGNHDLNKTSTSLSSFQVLCKVLGELHRPEKFQALFEPTLLPDNLGYVIPHMPNQDLFDAAIAKVPACSVLFLHCNYDNGFAAQSDQSLNLSKEQAFSCFAQCIVIAHEHQAKKFGKIWIPGNQIVTSVSDCIGAPTKQYVIVEDGKPKLNVLNDVAELFEEVDWQMLGHSDRLFVRVTGTAPAAVASEVVTAISNFRRASDALVISNAVTITNESGGEVFASSLESVKKFDVMSALKALLSVEEYAVVEKLQ